MTDVGTFPAKNERVLMFRHFCCLLIKRDSLFPERNWQLVV
jgi:hypothetical protein